MNDLKNINHRDTIVAISSPPGKSLRGLVRVAGANSAKILKQLSDINQPPRASKIIKTKLKAPLPALPIFITFFLAPKSYTADDIVEIQCPGNPALLGRIVQAALKNGARMAEPGEFTFRAFSAGKMDLIEAEGISATISAVSDSQLEAATMLRRGRLSNLTTKLVNELAEALALVEAGIDFVDQEDVVAITPQDLSKSLEEIKNNLNKLLSRSRSWSQLEGLPRVVLVGAPSAGKSTLFNALLGRTRAVASAIPGTTRDTLEEPLKLNTTRGDIEVMLVDIAGLEAETRSSTDISKLKCKRQKKATEITENSKQKSKNHSGKVVTYQPVRGAKAQKETVGQEAQNAAREKIKNADVILALQQIDEQDVKPGAAKIEKYLPHSADKITVYTKADLAEKKYKKASKTTALPFSLSYVAGFGAALPEDYIVTSAVTGTGIDELKQHIAQFVESSTINKSAHKLALQPRHEYALSAGKDAIELALNMVNIQKGNKDLEYSEIIAATLRSGLDELASLGGRMTADDVIGKIFATFCVGK